MNELPATIPATRGLKNQAMCEKDKSETEAVREFIEQAQAELGCAIDDLRTALAPVLRGEAPEKLGNSLAEPPTTTQVHAWLRGQLCLLRSHIELVRSIKARVEV